MFSVFKLNKVLTTSASAAWYTITARMVSRQPKLEYTKDRYKITRGPYNSLNEHHVQFFEETLGAKRVLTDPEDLNRYNVDLFKQFKGDSRIVLKPKTTQEVSKVLAFCNDNRLAVCPHGGNTGVAGASIPVFDEVVISAELMNNVLSVDDVSGIIVCEAGCVLENLNKHLSSKNLTVPLDIGSKGSCQIGGNVSTNAGGFRFARFGSLHGNVLGLEVVKANGEILDCLKSLRKDNTGYHLKNMFIGAEGTLGFITKVALQCVTKPNSVSVAFLGVESYEKVLQTYTLAKQRLGEILSALELIDAEAMDLVNSELNLHSPIGKYPFYLLIETYGSNEIHDLEKVNHFVEASLNNGFVLNGTVTSNVSKCEAIWKVREAISIAGNRSNYEFRYDLTLPIMEYYSLVPLMKEYMGEKAIAVYAFGHLRDGNIHLHIRVPEYTKELHDYIEPYIYEKVIELNGSITAEHGLGFKNAKYLRLGRNDSFVGTMKDIKKLLDPNGILNPYKVLSN